MMETDQLETMHELGKAGEAFGPQFDEVFTSAFVVHGHVCGGMPLGFRAGVAALRALEAEREGAMAHHVRVETSTGHAAGCFADGVQMATGCTFGKGLIRRTGYGKWALMLVEPASERAVRVAVRPEVMEAAFDSPFVAERKQGVPPTEIALEVSRPLVENLMAKDDAELFRVSEVFDAPSEPTPEPTFELVRCASCDEIVAANEVHLKADQPMCRPCSGYRPDPVAEALRAAAQRTGAD